MNLISEQAIQTNRYPAYKDSGIDWLGEIPAHWEVVKGKWLFDKQDRPVRKEDGVVTAFRDGQVTLRSNRREEGFTNAIQEHGYQGIRRGDLVIHAMDAFAGAIGVSDSDGKSSPVYAACTPRKGAAANPYFFAYFLRHLAKTGFIESLAKGIRERSTDFRFRDFGLLQLSVPPLEEQTRIAEFLDRKTAQIDQAIAQKERLIDLLNERRQVLIHRAVTRGLDPNAPMKDSGIDWLGEIPAHWEVKRAKYLFREVVENTKTGKEELLSLRMHIGLVPHNDVSDTEITDDNLIGYKIVRCGQLVMNRMRASIGLFGVANQYGLVSPDYAIYEVSSTVSPDYYLHLFKTQTMGTIFRLNSKGLGTGSSGFMRLYSENFGNIKISVPPKIEQQAICIFIDSANRKIDSSIAQIQQQIQKLQELKATLINSAVTGKIKV